MPDRTTRGLLAPERQRLLMAPNVQLYGPIGDASVRDVLQQIHGVLKGEAPLVFEMTTEGGDAEGGRRIALEIRLARDWHGRDTVFLGKTVVMSAGVTVMAAFPRADRYLTDDTVLLIHERRIQRSLAIDGPMRADLQIAREMVAQLESAQRTEREGFAELAEGSAITAEELTRRATTNCYLTAAEAFDLGLVAAVV